MSEYRSLTNFIGNAVAAILVARWERAVDMEQLRAAFAGRGGELTEAENDALQIEGEATWSLEIDGRRCYRPRRTARAWARGEPNFMVLMLFSARCIAAGKIERSVTGLYANSGSRQ